MTRTPTTPHATAGSDRSENGAVAALEPIVAVAVPPDAVESAAELASDGDAEERAVSLKERFFNVRTILSLLLGVFILVVVLRVTGVGFEETLANVRTLDPRLYALAIGTYALTFPVRGRRWQTFLRNVGVRLPLAPLTEVLFISWFVNSVLPGKIGDLYRGYLLKREYRLSLGRVVGTVVAERVIDILFLIAVLGGTGYFVLRDHVDPQMENLLHLGWVGFGALLVFMVVMYRWGDRVMSRFPARVRDAYATLAHGTFASMTNWPGLSLLTVLAWSAEAGRLYFVTQALHVSLTPMSALFAVAAISLALIVPTPGGLGGVETAFILVLAIFGVDRGLAVTVAFMDRLISFYSLIILGFPAFLFSKRGR